MTEKTRRVTDAPTRMFHWLFALCFTVAYLTSEGERWRMLHVTVGYTLAGLLVFRVLYGLFGPRQVRLSVLWNKLTTARHWARSLVSSNGNINWRPGQNGLMALAVVFMMLLVVPLTLSGYATFNDLGGEWLEEVHELVGNAFLMVVLAHLAFILGLSLLRRKNQALPMLTGRTYGAGPDLIKRNQGWLAVLLLVCVLFYWRWEWQQSPKGLLPSQPVSTWFSGHDDDGDD